MSGSGMAVREGSTADRTEEHSPEPGLLFEGRRWARAAGARTKRRVRIAAMGVGSRGAAMLRSEGLWRIQNG